MDFSEIEELSKHDIVVNRCLELYDRGHVTREQALVMMVTHLVHQKNEYFEQVVKMNQQR